MVVRLGATLAYHSRGRARVRARVRVRVRVRHTRLPFPRGVGRVMRGVP